MSYMTSDDCRVRRFIGLPPVTAGQSVTILKTLNTPKTSLVQGFKIVEVLFYLNHGSELIMDQSESWIKLIFKLVY